MFGARGAWCDVQAVPFRPPEKFFRLMVICILCCGVRLPVFNPLMHGPLHPMGSSDIRRQRPAGGLPDGCEGTPAFFLDEISPPGATLRLPFRWTPRPPLDLTRFL